MSKTILVLDSSQLATFLECPEKWQLTNIECLTKSNVVDDAMSAGTLMHKYLEIYYTYLGRGVDPQGAQMRALQFDPDDKDKSDNHQYPLGAEIRTQLRQRFIEYCMVYANGDYEVATASKYHITVDSKSGLPKDSSLNIPLVEQGFSYELLNTPEYLFVLEGRIDFIGSLKGNRLWMDHKLQFRQRSLYKKRIQFRNYSLALGYNLGIVNYIRMHKTCTKDTLVREPISFSSNENRLWRAELTDIYVDVARQQKLGNPLTSNLVKNRDACEGKYGYPCQYISICEEYNPQTQQAIKQQNFVKRVRWTPW